MFTQNLQEYFNKLLTVVSTPQNKIFSTIGIMDGYYRVFSLVEWYIRSMDLIKVLSDEWIWFGFETAIGHLFFILFGKKEE